jgi:archaellin
MEEIPEKYRSDLAIIRETVLQINRDINMDSMEVILSGNEQTAFVELKKQLIPIIEKLQKGDRSFFNSLLYRIDINEKDYRKMIENDSDVDFSAKLAELIIRREFQKVLTRRFFSDKTNKK